ncbi:MAG: flagellar type III secretion system pore protein FliP, partial [Sphingomonas sp.]
MPATIRRHGSGPSLFRTAPAPNKAGRAAKIVLVLLALLFALLVAMPAFAQTAPAVPAPAAPAVGDAVDRALGDLGGGKAPLALSLQILIIMGLLSVLPGILLMMTSFTRIVIVLALLRQALGLQQTPPNQVLIGLSLLLSFFVMAPTLDQMNKTAIEPYAQGKIGATEMIKDAGAPLHAF